MQTYTQMKDSGVAWLGDIPAEWNIKPLFSFVEEKKNKNSENLVDNVLSLSYGMIKKRELDNGGLLPESFATYQIVEADDIILRLTDLQNDKRSLRVGRSTQRGIITSAYVCIKPTKINSRYLYYLLHAYDLLKVFYNLGGGLRQGMKLDDLKRLPAFDIAPEQQLKIANYLDEETALIDDLIAKQQRLLALLEEKRRATITHAVTRGLNPSVDLKETNIPWLGKIPVHWKLKKARYLFDRIKDVPRNGDDVVTAFRDGEVVLRSLRRTEGFTFADKEIGYQHVSKGDLVIHAMDGFAGAIGVSKSDGKMSPVCSICRPKDESKINTEYFAQLVRTMAKSDWLTAIAKGIRERSTDFRWADFANMEFPLPPPEEQSAIINSIQDEELKLATLKNKINVQISFLKERRTSLISHAVTGKIKV